MSVGNRKSPCPPLWEMNAPDGQMRGPATTPASMACLSPNTGPPRSRTLVNPRKSMSVAALPAAMWMNPMSPTRTVNCGTEVNIRWTWASIRPGISVRPPPWIRVTDVPAGGAIGPLPMAWMMLPTTSTLDGADSRSDVPSNTRTFSNSTAAGGAAAGVWAYAGNAVSETTRGTASKGGRYFVLTRIGDLLRAGRLTGRGAGTELRR